MSLFIRKREDEIGGQGRWNRWMEDWPHFLFFFTNTVINYLSKGKRLGRAVYICVEISEWLFKNAINPDGSLTLVAGETGLCSCSGTSIFTSIYILLVLDIRRYRITYCTISVTAFACEAMYQICFPQQSKRRAAVCTHSCVAFVVPHIPPYHSQWEV